MNREGFSMENAARSDLNLDKRGLSPTVATQFDDISIEKYRVPAGDEHPLTSYPKHSIFIPLSGVFVCTRQKFNGSFGRTTSRRGNIGIIPANLPHGGYSATGGEFFGIQFDQSFLIRAADEKDYADKIELTSNFAASKPQIEHIGRALLAEAEAGNPAGRIYFDSAAMMLAVQILKNYAVTAPVFREYSGGLPKQKFRRAVEYIDANLDGDLALSEIAREAGMSPFHFARLFKQTAGVAPHAFVNRRLERAKQMLINRKKSVTEIAFDLGFSSHSHFTAFFRRHTGATPSCLRESLKN